MNQRLIPSVISVLITVKSFLLERCLCWLIPGPFLKLILTLLGIFINSVGIR